ncbi:unnamed protein product [Anisakis simplex]|uniref:CAD protein n=1 Tax=Anisakis simplex TaxID=6269 RepID=A0A158PMX1_ANISI|nr:unnamed protein product [Anisakis simplex]
MAEKNESGRLVPATLLLECDEGERAFHGQMFGHFGNVSGEIVFQTGMVGYVESLTDPSYASQLLVLTYPLIGNYGVPNEEFDEYGLSRHFESTSIQPAALIVNRVCPYGSESHWQSKRSIHDFLKASKVPGFTGVDTRMLTKIIREKGTMRARLIYEGSKEPIPPYIDINAENLVAKVSVQKPQTFGNGSIRILAVDCGMKNNQLRILLKHNVTVTVVPWNYAFHKEDGYDGLFLSSGPGDPAMCAETEQYLRAFMAKPDVKPIFGICLGHQILSRAFGGKTYKLKYGNRGHNQPCIHLGTGRCVITAQNHGYAVDNDALGDQLEALFVNANDHTNEGLFHRNLPYFSVQFHPEHSPGPTDTEFLFEIFVNLVENWKNGKRVMPKEMIEERFTYTSKRESKTQKKVLVLGSGGLTIGQAGEFDYSGAQALKALKEKGVETVLVNPNVATVQTSKGFANKTCFVPVNKHYVTQVIKKMRPSGILCTFGGQTALNCAVDLYKSGILKQYGVDVLGTPIETIMKTEDRALFKEHVESLGERVAPSEVASSLQEAVAVAEKLGYPVLVRASYALGGLGSGFANDRNELLEIAQKAFACSSQVFVDRSLKGWKELEYEVVRDAYDNCITVCNMENVDPVGIHTGESIVIAPSQTLNDDEYQKLRSVAIKVARSFGIVGECNIQYAVNPSTFEYYIIEMNARLSRSSALASKATGYPLAYVAAKLALGEQLPTIKNTVTGETTACFEPSLDYCVVKVPRWDLCKFARVSNKIGSVMKSVGEAMGIGRSFEEAFQKALRMANEGTVGFYPSTFSKIPELEDFTRPTDKRIFAIARGLYEGLCDANYAFGKASTIQQLTGIDLWFLRHMETIIETHHKMEKYTCPELPDDLLYQAKQYGFSDRQISRIIKNEKVELNIRRKRKQLKMLPCIKQIDTVAAEWPAATNYLYLTYNGCSDDVSFENKDGVIVLGSGVYRIGSSVEFDACCVGCVNELKTLGYKSIMINCNPETVSTDYDTCDRLYFEEISVEVVCDVYECEHPKGVVLAFGGQAPNNIATSLLELCQDLKIFGTSPDDIDVAENRFKFSRHLDELKILQPQWTRTDSVEEAEEFCNEVGYPCLIRPSYVLSGAAMNVAHNVDDLRTFLSHATVVAKDNPVVVSKFIKEAKEIDVDGVAFEGKLLALAICEHIENAGIHSGDATLLTPPQDINKITLEKIYTIARQLSKALNVNGPFNIQLIAKDNELKVIECNLRASRSLPFVTKALDFDFVALATRCLMANDKRSLYNVLKPVDVVSGVGRVGVKVPQFSFARLEGADAMLGVEMVSTGEVGCFGKNHYEAYLKGLLSTGFVMPKAKIFLSIGGYHAKAEMLNSVRMLHEMDFELLASRGTADYFMSNDIPVKTLEWPFEEETFEANEKTAAFSESIADLFTTKDVDLMINLPIRASGAYRVSAYRTHGYRARRMAIDNGIPLITDIKCAKLFIKALRFVGPNPPLNSQIDCLSSVALYRLPGLIDIHVHTRDPGHVHKETWETVTRAALAGGITMVLAMPNTNPSLTDKETFDLIEKIASSKSLIDYALFAGGTSTNSDELIQLAPSCAGLKLYLDETFSKLQMPSIADWKQHFDKFPKNRPIVCHAEQRSLMAVLAFAKLTARPVHIAHVSTAIEIEMIREAKRQGWPITCEVCPHHLFISNDNTSLRDGCEEVRPKLATSADVKALWNNIDVIDCFASDHAPHLLNEKHSDKVPGFSSIEYMVPLFLNAVKQGLLTMEQLIDRLYHNPKRIFNLPEQKNTYIEVDLEDEWTIPETGGQSQAGWSPYAGKTLKGRVKTVVLRGEEAYVDGNFVVQPGYGHNVRLDEQKESKVNAKKLYAGDGDTSLGTVDNLTDELTLQTGLVSSPEKSAEQSRRVSPTIRAPPFDELFKQRAFFTSVDGMSKEMCSVVFDLAAKYKRDVAKLIPLEHVLKGRVMALMFYEASTRTASSFASAMQRLGGSVVYFDPGKSSAKKGETLEDTVKIMCGYADVIVMRHPEEGAVARAASVTRRPIVNAGDGIGQHPTQALLDVFTIREEIGTVNNITIAMVGDLKNGRTVHSLAKLLCVYSGITLHYVIPCDDLAMPSYKVFKDLRKGITGVDVIYMTRIQRERFASQEEYDRMKGDFILTPSLLGAVTHPVGATCKGRERQLPIVMHPLPRVDEISHELDGDEQAAYFRQAENGVYVRMAVVSLVLNGTARL